ncbi:hypothetical protein IJU97_03020 [bacterium]|nr:hypothetical protein [bacterium]
MAISQTRKFFENYPGIKLIECSDTAFAFREITQQHLTTV